MRALISRTGLLLVALGAFVLLSWHLLLRTPRSRVVPPFSPIVPTSTAAPEPKVGNLHLLLPAHKATVDLCKAVLGAQALGYPSPSLPNWADDDQHATKSGFAPVGTLPHVRKLYGVLQYLERLDAAANDDLVIIMDAYDSWFQLPPEILINRYHEINDKAQERIDAHLGIVAKAEGVHQNIVFSAQKECWPGRANETTCYTMPESPLERDFYGPMTDQNSGGEDVYLYDTFRARHLNSGFIMGPVKAVRALYQRATQLADSIYNQFDSDQFVLTTIFAQQEYLRTINAKASDQSIPEAWRDIPNREEFKPSMQVEYEFGIGLDYRGALSFATVHSVNDSDFIVFNDGDSIEKALTKNGVHSSMSASMQDDLMDAKPPDALRTINGSQTPSVAAGDTPKLADKHDWTSISLFTNLRSGIVPATIHHNAWQGGLKSRRESLWPKVWYQGMARQIVSAAATASPPSGTIFTDTRGTTWLHSQPYLATGARKGLGATSTMANGTMIWHPWSELCAAKDEKEIFR